MSEINKYLEEIEKQIGEIMNIDGNEKRYIELLKIKQRITDIIKNTEKLEMNIRNKIKNCEHIYKRDVKIMEERSVYSCIKCGEYKE